ncbi:hypothetical protein, partial [Caballeronia sp. GaOx3]|uniref:hypothetical protein n=1 Tax=Caballeronia sp. GaOx3 TaxID=2921740 RepID=UPI0020292F42
MLRAQEKRGAHLLFEDADLLTQRRLRNVQPRGRAAANYIKVAPPPQTPKHHIKKTKPKKKKYKKKFY